MTLSINNEGYADWICIFDKIRFNAFYGWKEFQFLQILNDLSIKHLIKLILYENDVKLLKLRTKSV